MLMFHVTGFVVFGVYLRFGLQNVSVTFCQLQMQLVSILLLVVNVSWLSSILIEIGCSGMFVLLSLIDLELRIIFTYVVRASDQSIIDRQDILMPILLLLV